MASPPTIRSEAHPAAEAARVRAATDSGRTGDKIAFPDPAAAPLGTDAEAGDAGAAVTPGEMLATAPADGIPLPVGLAASNDGRGPGAADEQGRPLDGRYASWQQAKWIWIPLLVLVCAGVALFLLAGR